MNEIGYTYDVSYAQRGNGVNYSSTKESDLNVITKLNSESPYSPFTIEVDATTYTYVDIKIKGNWQASHTFQCIVDLKEPARNVNSDSLRFESY